MSNQYSSSESTTRHHMPQTVSGETLAQCLSHLTPNERAGLVAFINRLHQDYGANLLRVILFGSKARGDFDDQSDLDVLVVVRMSGDDYWQHWRRIVDTAWEVELAYSLVISSVIKNEPDYTKMCEHQSLLAHSVERDGIVLWTMSPKAFTSQPIQPGPRMIWRPPVLTWRMATGVELSIAPITQFFTLPLPL